LSKTYRGVPFRLSLVSGESGATVMNGDEELVKDQGNEELWHAVFADGAADLLDQRSFHSRLPSPPRCRLCKAPFKGLGGFFMRWRGKQPAKRNPNYCSACDMFLDQNPGGAEVPMAILFADIRKSTEFVRDHSPEEVARRINTFLDLATTSITDEDGFLLAFYGDCVLANWPPGFSGADYVEKAMRSAKALAAASRQAGIPVGIGLHSGDAYMSSVVAQKGSFRDVSVFGEAVNATARLSGAAGASEILTTASTARALGLNGPWESLTVKGFDAPIEVHRL